MHQTSCAGAVAAELNAMFAVGRCGICMFGFVGGMCCVPLWQCPQFSSKPHEASVLYQAVCCSAHCVACCCCASNQSWCWSWFLYTMSICSECVCLYGFSEYSQLLYVTCCSSKQARLGAIHLCAGMPRLCMLLCFMQDRDMCVRVCKLTQNAC